RAEELRRDAAGSGAPAGPERPTFGDAVPDQWTDLEHARVCKSVFLQGERADGAAERVPGVVVPAFAHRLSLVHAQIVSCERCPRLRAYCAEIARVKKRAYRDDTYWGKPVPGFG